jgi:hypothetical protein
MFWSGYWHRRRAQRLIRHGEWAMAAGQWAEALSANKAAESAVRAALAANAVGQDLRVLGSLLYNRAMILERLDKAGLAYDAASEALEIYHGVDPTWGSPKLVALALAGGRIPGSDTASVEFRQALNTADEQERIRILETIAEPHGMGWEEVQDVIAQAADARTRYHRLAALTGAASDPALSDTNITAPAETYRQLIAHGGRYTRADLDRMEARQAEIRHILGHGPA